MGLGLAISKGLIEAHGGRIWATTRPEGGLQITFTLPIGDTAASAQTALWLAQVGDITVCQTHGC